jgi:hypothetical protein
MSLTVDPSSPPLDGQLRSVLRWGPENLLPALIVRFAYATALAGVASAGLIWWRITQTVHGRGHLELLLGPV